eukprot:COSAG02_NODE_6245_length_3703_cov_3.909267_2_plen_76_part_00
MTSAPSIASLIASMTDPEIYVGASASQPVRMSDFGLDIEICNATFHILQTAQRKAAISIVSSCRLADIKSDIESL